MAASDLLASTVMDGAAALLNDPNKTKYTYAVQIPYLRIASQELKEEFELNSIAVTQETSSVIQINAGVTVIPYNGAGTATNPTLPSDMVEPAQLWERNRGIDPYIPMTKVQYLPHNLEGVEINQFVYYVWNKQEIKVLPSNTNNDIKIDYIRQLFSEIVDENTQINVINAKSFLEYRTAGLVSEFIERNITSANAMNAYAVLAMNRVTGIGAKGKQNIVTRSRPFRAGYKKRGWMT